MTKTKASPQQSIPRSRSSPRAPSRGRGVLRFAALVDSVESLLTEHSPDDVGLYQIAEHANVPPASVYHFFPTKEAAFLALTQRYLDEFAELTRRPIDAAALVSWQTLLAWDQRLAMEHYNAHPPALKLFLGGFGGLETRQAEIAYNAMIGEQMYQRFDAAFHMPFVRQPGTKFHVVIEMLDAIWRISYQKSGHITEEYRCEALDACVAYCRLFLPERTELRDEHREALTNGEPVILDHDPAGG